MLEENNNNFIQNNITTVPMQTEQYNTQNTFVPPTKAPKEITPTEKLKLQIKILGLGIGIPLLVLTFIPFIWQDIFVLIAVNICGASIESVSELIGNIAVQHILQITLSALMFLVPFGIAVRCMGTRISDTISFDAAKKGTFLPFVLFGVGFCIFANIAASQVSAIFEGLGGDYNVNHGEDPIGVWGFLLSFISTAIVPALVEEFACRGVILGLLKKHGEGFAIVVSSVLFGLMHGNFEQIPFAFVVGLALGYIYVKTDSIWPCVVVHFINNAVSVIFSYLIDAIGLEIGNMLYMLYLTIGLALAIFGVFLISKAGIEDYSLAPSDQTIAKTKTKYFWFFTSFAIIIFMAATLLESLIYLPLFQKLIGFLYSLLTALIGIGG